MSSNDSPPPAPQEAAIAAAIAALEARRDLLGSGVVDTALRALREQQAQRDAQRESSREAMREAPAAAGEQQLRQVSVLFADVVDSTAFSQRLDPEEVHQVMDGALARLSALVRAHEGQVLQYAGDSLLAAFGTPHAREDDAERALLAGLAILAEGRVLARGVSQRYGHEGFALRVGVHTGPVLLGGGVDGEHTIRGHTVNIAARMEQSAPPGALRISHDTWRHVRGLFDVQTQPPLQVKGQAEPMLTYLVERVRPRSERRVLRGVDGIDETPMVNRLQELAALQSAYQQVRGGGPSALTSLLLVGEAGIGKSRLGSEFRRRLASQVPASAWLEAHAGERDSGQPYGLLREVFMRWLGILDSDTLPLARRKWLDGMAPLLRSEGDAAVLGHLMGLDFSEHAELRGLIGDARQLRDRGFFHAAQALRAMAPPGEPLLLLLDDLQWADEGTLDFIEQLQAAHGDMRLLLIGLTRPTLYERRPGWQRALPSARRVDMLPLDGDCSNALANALLRRLPEVPPALRALITQGAEGNPFFMEELVNMLIDQGVIVPGAQGWQLLAERLQGLALPSTLTGVLQARLDALPGDELHLLQLAAVVGPVFWDDALRALGVVALGALHALVERELVVAREGSSLEGRREFAFRHHSLQQVAYERLLKRFKRPAHAQVALWLAAQPGAAPELVAEHFERGGELTLALDHWQHAAEAAHGRYALAEALQHAERALALVPAHADARRWALLYLKVRVLDHLGAHEALAGALDQLQAVADASGQKTWQVHVLERRGRYHYESGDALAALQSAEQAIALAGETADGGDGADAECTVSAHALRVFALGRLGRHAEARAAAAQALARARAAGLVRTEAAVLNEIGNYLIDEGDFGAAIEHLNQALLLHRRAADKLNEGGTLANLAFAAMTLGDYATAQQQFNQARALCAAIGQRRNEGVIHVNLGLVLLNLGQAAAAQAHARQALALLRASGSRWGEAAALRVAGQAGLALGEGAAAEQLLHDSREVFDQLKLPHLAIEAMAALAAAALVRGELVQAQAEVEGILARLAAGAGLEGTDEPLRILLVCWQVLHAAGDARASAQLAAAWQELSLRAERIGDAQRRQDFLQAVPFHRQIVEAWQRAQPSATGALTS